MTNLSIYSEIVEVAVPEHWKNGVGVRSTVLEAIAHGVRAEHPDALGHDRPELDEDRHVLTYRLYFWGEAEVPEDLEAKHQERVEKLVTDHQRHELFLRRQNAGLQEQVNTLNGFMRRIQETTSGPRRQDVLVEWLTWKSDIDVRRAEGR